MKRWMAVLLIVGMVALVGCSKDVPDKPNKEGSESEPVSVLSTLETKQAVFERVGEFTYPIDYVMSGSPGDYKLRDGIYYSMHIINQVVPAAKSLEDFAEYVSYISKVSLREYNKVHAEEMTLDGCTAWYVEGHGKDSSKYKYTVYMGINTDNGMTVASAVVNEEDWASKGAICKEIMMSFKHKGMIDPADLKTVLTGKTLKPSLEIPESWKVVSDETNTKVYKNETNSVEMTVFFGKQDNASLENIMSKNGITWNVRKEMKQGFESTIATGTFIPVVVSESDGEEEGEETSSAAESPESKVEGKDSEDEESADGVVPGCLDYYAMEVTDNGYRFIIAIVTKVDTVTAEELVELQDVLDAVVLYELSEEEQAERDSARAEKERLRKEEEARLAEEAENSENSGDGDTQG